jgi:Ca2+-binding RTX toxin-like protein
MAARPTRFCEALERRSLLSAIHLVGRLLDIAGDAAAENTIVVGLSPDGASVDASVTWTNSLGQAQNLSDAFPVGEVRLVEIRGGRVGNIISIDQANGSFSIPTHIIGSGRGSDNILTGNEDDTIIAGSGNDTIQTGDGNDEVHAGRGDDTIRVGSGRDTLTGGSGLGTIYAGGGTDRIYSGPGFSTLVSGTGPDIFFIHSKKRTPIEGFSAGKDKIRYLAWPTGPSVGQQILNDIFPLF